jgi:type IX secretion system PorP/SprF family membrane protein
MKLKKYIVIVISFCAMQFLNAQDMHFTQFYAAPLYLNPAFTGANACSRATLVYRNQWPGINRTYRSYLLSMDHFFQTQKIGVGLLMGVDDAGTGGLRTTLINPNIAYETKINKNWAVRVGFQPGITIKSINFNKLLFGDQIARGGSANPSSVATVEEPTINKTFVSLGTGALIYTSNFWIGSSFYNLNKPNESLMANDQVVLPVRYSVHAGTKFLLNKEEKDPDLIKSISLVAHYRGQGEFDQFDIGFYYTQSFFNIGFWYRGLPGIKDYKPGYTNHDAVATVIGFQKDRLSIGYSYDITISILSTNLSRGAHEITLSYQFCKLKEKKTKRTLISCPKF